MRQLATGHYVGAQTTFEEYQSVADDSDEPSAVLMAAGWLIIPQILACKAQKKDLLIFKKIRNDLSAHADSKF
ncbi:MAG: hypothetical protein CMP98_10260 [Gammaproteobacteria bacterium]|nr:hypothetical protein [Gammaproteobacteria bacterium]OUU08382.1 MAG: hypothetical protein CBB94_10490 [Gammaproteobacteria bacterium TMED34]